MKKATVVFITLIVAATAAARTITVDDDNPADFPTIQAAIDDANEGDTIIVADGSYTGDGNRDVDFKGKAITLESANGPENCIIDCNGTSDDPHRGFYFHSNEDANSVLAGFTIQNGYAPTEETGTWPEPVGGAICCLGSGPTVTECVITGNTAQGGSVGGSGGGIYCRDANMVIANCIIEDNGKLSNIPYDPVGTLWGGGIGMSGGCVKIVDCTITNNRAYMGGGLSCLETRLSVLNCKIDGNYAEGGGGACLAGYALLSNCRITDNVAKGLGGGIAWVFDPNGIVENCVISNNAVNESPGGGFIGGSALYLQGGNPQVRNCTICFNEFSYSGEPDTGAVHCQDGSGSAISNCILWANEVAAIAHGDPLVSCSNIEGGWPGEGNIDADPCFVDPNSGDYHLRSERGRYWPEHDVWVLDKVTSPCIDAGDPYDDPSAEPMPNGDLVNMGAYGGTSYASMSEWALRGDVNYDGIVNMIDFSIFGDYWLQPSLRAREIDGRLVCAANLGALARALRIYANDHDDEFPTAGQWCDLLLQHEPSHVTEELFVCPTAEPGRSHYAINPNATDSASPPDMVLLFETGPGWNQFGGPELLAPENHQGKGCHILFVDGHVEFVKTGRFDELRWERK